MGANGTSGNSTLIELMRINQDLSEVKKYMSPFLCLKNVFGILKKIEVSKQLKKL